MDDLLILGFRFFGHEVPGARLERARYIDGDKLGPVLRSMWRRGDGLVAIDVLEGDSADDAEQALQQVLRDVQSPLVVRTETADLGDTAYAAPGGGGVYFARANLVMIVRDAGDAASVLDAARAGRCHPRSAESTCPTRVRSTSTSPTRSSVLFG